MTMEFSVGQHNAHYEASFGARARLAARLRGRQGRSSPTCSVRRPPRSAVCPRSVAAPRRAGTAVGDRHRPRLHRHRRYRSRDQSGDRRRGAAPFHWSIYDGATLPFADGSFDLAASHAGTRAGAARIPPRIGPGRAGIRLCRGAVRAARGPTPGAAVNARYRHQFLYARHVPPGAGDRGSRLGRRHIPQPGGAWIPFVASEGLAKSIVRKTLLALGPGLATRLATYHCRALCRRDAAAALARPLSHGAARGRLQQHDHSLYNRLYNELVDRRLISPCCPAQRRGRSILGRVVRRYTAHRARPVDPAVAIASYPCQFRDRAPWAPVPDLLFVNGLYPSMLGGAAWARQPQGIGADHRRLARTMLIPPIIAWRPGCCAIARCGVLRRQGGDQPLAARRARRRPVRGAAGAGVDPPEDVPAFDERPFHLLWCARINDDAKNAIFFENVVIALGRTRRAERSGGVRCGRAAHAGAAALPSSSRTTATCRGRRYRSLSAVAVLLLPSLLEPWGWCATRPAVRSPVPGVAAWSRWQVVRDGDGGYVRADEQAWVDAGARRAGRSTRWAVMSRGPAKRAGDAPRTRPCVSRPRSIMPWVRQTWGSCAMIGRWLSRTDVFLHAYLVMVLGCVYFLFISSKASRSPREPVNPPCPRRMAAALRSADIACRGRSEAFRRAAAALASLPGVHICRGRIVGREYRCRGFVGQIRDVSHDHAVRGVGRDPLSSRSSRRHPVPDRGRRADRSRRAVSSDWLAMGL